MTSHDPIEVLEFHASTAESALLEELLAVLEADAAVWHDVETDETVVRAYADSKAVITQLNDRLQAAFRNFPGMIGAGLRDPVFRTLAREDWAETWKRYFHVFHASSRLVIKPSWEAYETAGEEVVIELDPGMSFGTGHHGTTQACLQFIDALEPMIPGASFLDAGCGSGILSIAAWKLGFRPVVAFDFDPQAVDVARENVALAGAEVQLLTADLGTLDLGIRFRLVAANILAPVLQRYAERLVAHLDTVENQPAWLILSGILTDQYDAVKGCFEGYGLIEDRRVTLHEWTSGLFQLSAD